MKIANRNNTAIYIDGSYNPADGSAGAGLLIVDSHANIEVGRQLMPSLPEIKELQNVACECHALLIVADLINSGDIQSAHVYYDCDVISQVLAVGCFSNKHPFLRTVRRKVFPLFVEGKLKISHVKSHKGNRYSGAVDSVAKEARTATFVRPQ